jgi:hypothetical protein
VRRGQRGSTLVPIELVEAVSPTERILYLRRRPSAASRAAVGISALGPYGRRAGRRTAIVLVALWRITVPYAHATARAAVSASRRSRPHVQRGILAIAQGAILLALMLQALVVAASIAGARFLRFCFLAACRLSPHGARFAGGSVALARRALR